MPHTKRTVRDGSRLVVSAVVLLAVAVVAGSVGSSTVGAGRQETEALRIEVTLDEYSFSPDPLRIPAGRPVTLVIRNAGRFPHEFMAGREVAGDDFEHDLFADVHDVFRRYQWLQRLSS